MAVTRAYTFSPLEKPASSKLSRVITDVSLGELPVHPPTHIVTWAIISSVLMLSISPIKLFRTPASKILTSYLIIGSLSLQQDFLAPHKHYGNVQLFPQYTSIIPPYTLNYSTPNKKIGILFYGNYIYTISHLTLHRNV